MKRILYLFVFSIFFLCRLMKVFSYLKDNLYVTLSFKKYEKIKTSMAIDMKKYLFIYFFRSISNSLWYPSNFLNGVPNGCSHVSPSLRYICWSASSGCFYVNFLSQCHIEEKKLYYYIMILRGLFQVRFIYCLLLWLPLRGANILVVPLSKNEQLMTWVT